jgi:hypothetical protein
MKKALLKFITIYALFLLLFLLLKPAFMAIYAGVIQASAGDWWAVVRHGLSMDLCVAAYFTVIPGLLITASLITPARIVGRLLDGYMAVVSVAIAALYVLDFGLYGSWGFRLDMTPMFYIATSPTAAMASVEWWHWLCGLLGLAAIGGGLFAAYRFTARRLQVTPPADKARRVWQPLLLFLLTGPADSWRGVGCHDEPQQCLLLIESAPESCGNQPGFQSALLGQSPKQFR